MLFETRRLVRFTEGMTVFWRVERLTSYTRQKQYIKLFLNSEWLGLKRSFQRLNSCVLVADHPFFGRALTETKHWDMESLNLR